MSLFTEIRNGSLTIPHPGNKNILSTIPLSLDPDNRGGIAPLEFPSGLDLFRTTPGTIKDASNLHRDQTPYPLNEIVFDQVEPRQQIADELLFDKPLQPAPPRQYELETNHALELSQQFYPDGTPMHSMPVDPISQRRALIDRHARAVQDTQKITEPELRQARLQDIAAELLAEDPALYTAMYQHIASNAADRRRKIISRTRKRKKSQPSAADPDAPDAPDDVVKPVDLVKPEPDSDPEFQDFSPPGSPRGHPEPASVHAVVDALDEDEKSYEPPAAPVLGPSSVVNASVYRGGLLQSSFSPAQQKQPVRGTRATVKDVLVMKRDDLYALSKALGMTGVSKLNRAELQRAIINGYTSIQISE